MHTARSIELKQRAEIGTGNRLLEDVMIGRNADIGNENTVRGTVQLGNRVLLTDENHIDGDRIRIGDYTSIQASHLAGTISIGKYSILAPDVAIHQHDHDFRRPAAQENIL